MVKRGMEKNIFKFIRDSSRPVSTREISETLEISWHTADRYCLKLQLKKLVDNFKIGNSTAWFTNKRKYVE